MDYASAINDLVSRMTDENALKNYYEQGKKLLKKSRCAPRQRIERREDPPELPELGVNVRTRTRR